MLGWFRALMPREERFFELGGRRGNAVFGDLSWHSRFYDPYHHRRDYWGRGRPQGRRCPLERGKQRRVCVDRDAAGDRAVRLSFL